MDPVYVPPEKSKTVPPYNLNKLPKKMGKFSRQLLKRSASVGIKYAPLVGE